MRVKATFFFSVILLIPVWTLVSCGQENSGENDSWNRVVAEAQRKRAASEYAGGFRTGDIVSIEKGMAEADGRKSGRDAKEILLLKKVRNEAWDESDGASEMLYRLSQASLYGAIKSGDDAARGLLEQLADSALERAEKFKSMRRKLARYAKSSEGELALEYSKAAGEMERIGGVFSEIHSFANALIAMDKGNSFESLAASKYAVLAVAARRLERERAKYRDETR